MLCLLSGVGVKSVHFSHSSVYFNKLAPDFPLFFGVESGSGTPISLFYLF